MVYVFCNITRRRRRRRTQRRPSFNSEEIEKLIDLWHKEPVLYNCQSGDYMNKDARAAAVGRIFVALEKEGKLIRTTRTEGGETEEDANNVFKPSLPLSRPRELHTIFSCCKQKLPRVNQP